MKPFGVLMTTAALLLLNDAALAQERGARDGNRNPVRTDADRSVRGDGYGSEKHWNREARGDHGHWRHGGHAGRPHYSSGWHGHHAPHYHYSRGPHWRSHPSWIYAAPVVPLYSYTTWERPIYVERFIEREPVVVERFIEREPVYVERIIERPRDPVYAQATPPAPVAPSRPVAAPARLERYTLSATELFEFDKATLRMPQPKLDEIAQVMSRNPQIDKVTITGHTDRIGTDAYNKKLSQQRADAVKAYFMQKGIAGSRLVAIGKGEAEPVVQCNEKSQAALIKCLEPNRRVEVEQITVELRK